MLYWKNVPPPIALSYFYKEYASYPTTAKFAAETLQQFKPLRFVHTVALCSHSIAMCIKFSWLCYNVIYVFTCRMKFGFSTTGAGLEMWEGMYICTQH